MQETTQRQNELPGVNSLNITRSVRTKWRPDMWFVSKKKYNELLEQKKDFERIATDVVAQNGRLLEDWGAAIEKMESNTLIFFKSVASSILIPTSPFS